MKKKIDWVYYLVIGVILILSISFCIHSAYKYYTFPVQKTVHCYAYSDIEKLDVDYVIVNGKILRKVEKRTYDYNLEIEERLNKTFDVTKSGKYVGYMQKLWHDDNEIMKMEFYDFGKLSDDSLKVLLGVKNKDEYLKGDKNSILKQYNNEGFKCEWSD